MITQWKRIPQKYGSPIEALYCGKIRVGETFWEKISKGDPECYRFRCRLPGLSDTHMSGTSPTEQKAKERLELIVKYWFEKVNEH